MSFKSLASDTQNITQKNQCSCNVLQLSEVACADKLKTHLNLLSRDFPGIWKALSDAHTLRSPSIPEWCYLPMDNEYEVISNYLDDFKLDKETRTHSEFMLMTYNKWRLTQGIYRFDPTLYEAVINTPVTGVMPEDVFHRIPEWCVFVETPGLQFGGNEMAGFFAIVDYDTSTSESVLHLHLEFARSFTYISFPLGTDSLLDAVRKTMDADHNVEEVTKPNTFFKNSFEEGVKLATTELEPILALLIYLCSQNSEIGDEFRRPSHPKPQKTKRGWKLFPPNQATTWDVGVRIGAALRHAYNYGVQSGYNQCGSTQSTKRPHIRRAHWHNYRLGPRLDMAGIAIPSEKRKTELKWLPPIAVKLDDPGQLPGTIRPIDSVPMVL